MKKKYLFKCTIYLINVNLLVGCWICFFFKEFLLEQFVDHVQPKIIRPCVEEVVESGFGWTGSRKDIILLAYDLKNMMNGSWSLPTCATWRLKLSWCSLFWPCRSLQLNCFIYSYSAQCTILFWSHQVQIMVFFKWKPRLTLGVGISPEAIHSFPFFISYPQSRFGLLVSTYCSTASKMLRENLKKSFFVFFIEFMRHLCF